MNVIASQAPPFELRRDRGICLLLVECTVPGSCAIRPDATWCGRHQVERSVPGSRAIRPDWCGRLYREGSQLRKILALPNVVRDVLRESWSGQQRDRRADGNDASDSCHETLQGFTATASDRRPPFKEGKRDALWLDRKKLPVSLLKCGLP
jgi:hypothetical protein